MLHAGVVGFALGDLLHEHRAGHFPLTVESRGEKAPRRDAIHRNVLPIHIGLEHQAAARCRCFHTAAEVSQHPLIFPLQIVRPGAAGDGALHLHRGEPGNFPGHGGGQAKALGGVIQPRRFIHEHGGPLVNGCLHFGANGHIHLEGPLCVVDMQHLGKNTSNPCQKSL